MAKRDEENGKYVLRERFKQKNHEESEKMGEHEIELNKKGLRLYCERRRMLDRLAEPNHVVRKSDIQFDENGKWVRR